MTNAIKQTKPVGNKARKANAKPSNVVVLKQKITFAVNTKKAIADVVKAQGSMLKATGGLASSIMLDLRASGKFLAQASQEVQSVIKASDLTDASKKMYSACAGKIGKAYDEASKIPAGDLKSIYDAIRASKGKPAPKGKVSRTTRAPKVADKEPKPALGNVIHLSDLRALPNKLVKHLGSNFSMQSKELYQAFLVQVDLDYKKAGKK